MEANMIILFSLPVVITIIGSVLGITFRDSFKIVRSFGLSMVILGGFMFACYFTGDKTVLETFKIVALVNGGIALFSSLLNIFLLKVAD